MYIQNYNDLDEECQKLAENIGIIGAILINHPDTRPKHTPMFRRMLVGLSQKTGRPIEVCSVKGEVWINIRERNPIPKEQETSWIEPRSLSIAPIGPLIKKMKEKFGDGPFMIDLGWNKPQMAVPPADMADRIKSQWRW